MNKTELAAKLAHKTGLTQAAAAEVVDTIFSTKDGEGIIAVELDAGRKVSIAGFGTFETRRSSARKGRNPQTGESIKIKATNVVKFRPGKKLRDAI